MNHASSQEEEAHNDHENRAGRENGSAESLVDTVVDNLTKIQILALSQVLPNAIKHDDTAQFLRFSDRTLGIVAWETHTPNWLREVPRKAQVNC